MDGASAAASIVGIATAGIQISIKLVTLSTQISTAPERVSAVASDISLTAGILQQLGDLMEKDTSDSHDHILNQGALDTMQMSALVCERVFTEIKMELGKASLQLRSCKRLAGGKIKLSKIEMMKWPFVQPSIDTLREDLKEAKGSLMLLLQLWLLAIARKTAEINNSVSFNIVEQRDMIRALVAVNMQPQLRAHQRDDTTTPGAQQRSNEEGPQSIKSNTNEVEMCQELPISPAAERTEHSATRQPCEVSDNKSISNPSEVSSLVSKSSDDLDTDDDCEVHDGQISNADDEGLQPPNRHNSRTTPDSRPLSSTIIEQNDNALKEESLLRSPFISPGNSSVIHVRKSETLESTTQGEATSELSLLELKADVRDLMVDPKGGVPIVALVWLLRKLKVEQSAIRDYLSRQRQSQSTVIQMMNSLGSHEYIELDRELRATTSRAEGTVLSLIRTYTKIEYRGMIYERVPGLQLVIRRDVSQNLGYQKGIKNELRSMMIRVKDWRASWREKKARPNLVEREGTFIVKSDAEPTLDRQAKKRQQDEGILMTEGSTRPTYLKVHSKHVCPETLIAFDLPWDWDNRNLNYIIIKTWLPEDDQIVLFEHTKKLRERRRLHVESTTEPAIELRRESDHLCLVRRRSPRPEYKIRHAPNSSVTEHADPQVEGETEDADTAIVDALLKKYTNLFENDDRARSTSRSRSWIIT